MNLMLSQLNEYCQDPKKVKALQALYECRYLRSLKAETDEKKRAIMQSLHLDGDINPIVYGLVGKRNGYALNHICKNIFQDFSSQLINKYNLPINLATMVFIEKEARIKDLFNERGLKHTVLLYENEKAKEEHKLVKDKYDEKIIALKNARKNRRKKEVKKEAPPASKKKKKKVVALPKKTPSYTGENSYIITCPALELVKTFGIKANEKYDIEEQILSMKNESKK